MKKIKSLIAALKDADALPIQERLVIRLILLKKVLSTVITLNIHKLRENGINLTDNEFARLLLDRAAQKGSRPKKEIISSEPHLYFECVSSFNQFGDITGKTNVSRYNVIDTITNNIVAEGVKNA